MNPIIKWAGGKEKELPYIKENLPSNIKRYIEPFVGGGAVYFYLNVKKSIINDKSEELINLYSYQHHQYESVVIPLKLNEELYQEILKYQNELFINHEKEKNREVYYNLHAYKTELFTEEDYYVFDYVINSNEEAFINYLKNDNEISIDSDIIYIKAYDFKDYTITIGNITSFKQEFDRYKENLKDSEEYQSLLNEYHNMMNTGAYD